MAIRRQYYKKFKGVEMKSGYFYTFKYSAWENDPTPTIILMYALDGIHPTTGHQWRFFQAINFTYIPRSVRKRFLLEWKRVLSNTQNPKFTWELIKRKYPWLKIATRRYFFKPNYYIKDLKEIPFDQIDKVIISTWSKDFSKKVKTSLINKFRSVLRNRGTSKKKKKTRRK
jgi:hypothetical protein